MSPMLGPRAINISVVTSMSSDILIYDFMGQPSPLFINFLLFFKLHLTAETVPKTHSENLDRKRRRRSLWPLTIVFDKNGPIRGLFNVHFLSYSNIRGSWHRPDPQSYGGHPPPVDNIRFYGKICFARLFPQSRATSLTRTKCDQMLEWKYPNFLPMLPKKGP